MSPWQLLSVCLSLQVSIALISFLETMLLIYLSYKVSARGWTVMCRLGLTPAHELISVSLSCLKHPERTFVSAVAVFLSYSPLGCWISVWQSWGIFFFCLPLDSDLFYKSSRLFWGPD